jgi:MraZ protein
MLYTGANELTIDDKKRLSIPAAIRNAMDPAVDGTRFFVTLGDWPGTLSLYGNVYFRRYARRLARDMAPGTERQTFEKVFYSKCAEVDIDRQGRITIPEHMTDSVGLGRQVCLTGARDHLDLWNREAYDKFIEEYQNKIMELQNRARQAMHQGFGSARGEAAR